MSEHDILPEDKDIRELCRQLQGIIFEQGRTPIVVETITTLKALIHKAIESAPPERPTPDEISPQQLDRDIAAIWGNRELLTNIRQSHQLHPDELRPAWEALNDISRSTLRERYGLFATQRATYVAIGARTGRSRDAVKAIEEGALAQLREFLWPSHGFIGLNPRIIKLFARASILHPADLYDRRQTRVGSSGDQFINTNDLYRLHGWGPVASELLTHWLTEHGHPALSIRP